MSRTVYRCKEGMVCGANGRRYHFAEGDLIFEDHPINPKRNPFFEEVAEYVERRSHQPTRRIRQEPVIEEATAEPGDKRRRGWPATTTDKTNTATATATAADVQTSTVTQKEKASPVAQKEKASDGQE